MDRQAKINALLYPKGKPSSMTPLLLNVLRNALDRPQLFKGECIDSECPGDGGWPCYEFDKKCPDLVDFINTNNQDKSNPIKIVIEDNKNKEIQYIKTIPNYDNDTITYVLY